MKFSWKLLNEIIDLKHLSLKEVANKLTLAGFEIDEISHIPEIKDHTIELSITANRQDAYSIMGLAKEISSILNIPINKNLNYEILYYNQQLSSKLIENSSIDTILNIQNKISPIWLKNYLQACDIKSTNIFNDITEYIKIKWGLEINIFDATKIDNKYINTKSFIITNDIEDEISINNKTINSNINLEIIKYKNKLISINGITSNNQLKYNIETDQIILYGKTYNNKYLKTIIANTEFKISDRIKTSINHNFFQAYNEALQLLRIYTKGIQGKSSIYIKEKRPNRKIYIKKRNIEEILGYIKKKPRTFLHTQQILQILQQLHFKPQYNNIKHEFTIYVPIYRNEDLLRPIDIIEEIGRIHGFNKFENNLPKIITNGKISKNTKVIKKIRKILRDIGLNEVIHYSLGKQNKNINLNKIEIRNPLIQEQAGLRYNIASSLINTKQYNLYQKNLNTEFFEIGRIFKYKSLNTLSYEEQLNLGGLIGNEIFSRNSWNEKPNEMNWFQAKGLLEDFFEKLEAKVSWKPYSEKIRPFFLSEFVNIISKDRSAYIYNNKTEEIIGILAELIDKNNRINCLTYIFEINIKLLNNSIKKSTNTDCIFKNYSTYPSITRDISILLKKSEYIDNIKCEILKNNHPLIESVDIFNEYKTPYPIGNRHIGLRITYRSKDKTLQDNDLIQVNKTINNLLKKYLK